MSQGKQKLVNASCEGRLTEAVREQRVGRQGVVGLADLDNSCNSFVSKPQWQARTVQHDLEFDVQVVEELQRDEAAPGTRGLD